MNFSILLSLRKISTLLKEEHGYSISFKSVGNILEDIDWMKKEKRRMNRKGKSSPILNVV